MAIVSIHVASTGSFRARPLRRRRCPAASLPVHPMRCACQRCTPRGYSRARRIGLGLVLAVPVYLLMTMVAPL